MPGKQYDSATQRANEQLLTIEASIKGDTSEIPSTNMPYAIIGRTILDAGRSDPGLAIGSGVGALPFRRHEECRVQAEGARRGRRDVESGDRGGRRPIEEPFQACDRRRGNRKARGPGGEIER